MDDTQEPKVIEAEIIGEPTQADGQPEPSPEPIIEVPTTEPVTPEPTPVIPESPEPPTEESVPPVAPATSEAPTEPTVAPEETLNVPPPPVLDATGVEMSTIRSDETGDKVYLLREKKRYWIKNPETLTKLGFYLGKEKRLPFSELLAFPEGEPMDLTIPGFILPWDRPVEEQKPVQSSNVWA